MPVRVDLKLSYQNPSRTRLTMVERQTPAATSHILRNIQFCRQLHLQHALVRRPG